MPFGLTCHPGTYQGFALQDVSRCRWHVMVRHEAAANEQVMPKNTCSLCHLGSACGCLPFGCQLQVCCGGHQCSNGWSHGCGCMCVTMHTTSRPYYLLNRQRPLTGLQVFTAVHTLVRLPTKTELTLQLPKQLDPTAAGWSSEGEQNQAPLAMGSGGGALQTAASGIMPRQQGSTPKHTVGRSGLPHARQAII